MQGRILKGVGGFYYVHAEDGEIYACRAKGIFRKEGVKPLPGDIVSLEVTHEKDREGSLISIAERKNVLIRPAAANIDKVLVVFSVTEPEPNLNLLDRFLIYMGAQGLTSSIFFNKEDIDAKAEGKRLKDIYESAGYRVLLGSVKEEDVKTEIEELLYGSTTILAGPSGVGKSSLINLLHGRILSETGELSERIKRGKQTTRHTEIFSIGEGSYILDTPGFTSLSLTELHIDGLKSEDIKYYYDEFATYFPKCRYNTCSHIHEPEELCAVKQALSRGELHRERYENYVQIYEEMRAAERH
ncbi:MAG TPA: ribosome small subunit-dependent GTPase A [Candidatus Avilachnospira avistercoris]|nr:ribosome small subunit-dependent GTPase A [Candidatus Avilachnospira avistercoris]